MGAGGRADSGRSRQAERARLRPRMGRLAWSRARGGRPVRWAVAAWALAATSLGACASFPSIPPLWEVESDLPGGVTVSRALFGLYEDERGPEGRTQVLRPFGMLTHGEDKSSLYVLPPFYLNTRDGVREETYLAPVFHTSSFGTRTQREADESDDDSAVFPLLFWGEEPGEGSYFMAFPFWGSVKGKLLADEIRVRGFPLYADTRSDGWSSHHVLWPLIGWGSGEDRSFFRVLPFWMQSDSGENSRRSVLWPFVHWDHQEQPERTLDGWFVFPFVGRRTASDGSSRQTTFLYPLFQFASDDRTGDTYRGILWPFYKRSVRPGDSESTWWWPFYGEYTSAREQSTFWAWPFVWNQSETEGATARVRDYVVPFWMRSRSGPPGEPTTSTVIRSWPLFASEVHDDGRSSLRVPDLLPVFGWEPGERVYSDLLSLYRRRSDAEGRVAWDAPLGIVRYRRGLDGQRRLTLLWWLDIPLGSDTPDDVDDAGGAR